ncbi:MAG: PQQ-binding-like beta-propeller repeat protein [Anaeromyxobacter sp.]|nr:PQQ-binding-like beta-propeller repeat protein [Anaeromyxobacter sp.]MBL0277903.1 PQQ-binding-like beta-propeller repeat protein [Anaeromyxobacter sp.]
MTWLALALALAATPAQGGRLPPAPRALYQVAWARPLAQKALGELTPSEPGGAAVDAVTGLVVVGTRDGWLHALRADGSLAWDFQADGPFAAEPLVDGDTVYAGSHDGRLYALALGTGKERWRYDAREQLGTRPALIEGLVVVASLQDTVFAVDARTGAWKWHHRREQREGFTIRGAAAVAAGDGLVHAGYSDGTLLALEAGSGVVRWERQAAPSGSYTDVDSLVVQGGRVFAAAYSGAVVALEAATGKPLWQVLAPEATRVTMGPATLLVVTSTKVLALSPVDGRVAWSVPLEGSPGGAPRVSGRWLLVPAEQGGLRFLELASGRTVRVLDPGTGVGSSPGLAPGRAYVLSNGGLLVALDLR